MTFLSGESKMWQPEKTHDTKIVMALLGRGNDIPLKAAT